LTDELIREFAAGNLYFNIHTAANPAGELRGQIRPGEVVATAIEQLTDVVPGAYRLAQNYPNPFNPVTTITFDLPRTTRARLDVYDVLGRTVAVLLDARLTPGTYAVTFDATALPSGVYFYRLTAGDVVRTRQMAVLK
ncbi:MAG: T9SS C-terminal target domain-containing protein, partial [Bacteroidetes bacterium]